MGVGPAHQPRSPLAFPSGGWAIFPTHGTVPHNETRFFVYKFFIVKGCILIFSSHYFFLTHFLKIMVLLLIH